MIPNILISNRDSATPVLASFTLMLGLSWAAIAPAQGDAAEKAEQAPQPQPQVENAEASNDDTKKILPDELSIAERVRRQEQYVLGQSEMERGMELIQADKFESAVQRLNSAIEHFRNAGRTAAIEERVEAANNAKSKAYYGWAEQLADEGEKLAETAQFDEAISKLRRAMELNPARQELYRDKIRELVDAKKEAKLRAATADRNVMPDKEERRQNLEKLVEQGRIFFEAGRYTDARGKFEEALVIDPYNMAAKSYLRKVHNKLNEWGEERRKTTRSEKLAEATWEWNAPVRPIQGEPGEEGAGRPVAKLEETKVQEKIREIIIPELEFNEATIHQVISFLRKKSKELDPEGKGINIVLYLPTERGAGGQGRTTTEEPGFPEAAPEDAWEWPEEGEGEPAEPAEAGEAPPPGSRTITLEMSDIPLGDAIKFVCQAANLDYVVERNAIVIADEGAGFGREMITRFYPVKVGIFDMERTTQAEALDEWGVDEDAGAQTEESGIGSQNIKQYFSDLGVNFPEESTIAFDQRTSKLIVHNTEQNLRKIEEILRELNITPTQVIEAKFVEINQEDLEGLGFEWSITNGIGGENADFKLNAGSQNPEIIPTEFLEAGGDFVDGDPSTPEMDLIPTAYEKILVPSDAIFDSSFNTGVRSLSEALGTVGASDTGLLGVSAVLGAMEVQGLIHAIDQAKSTDVLSAPKVTTTSNNTAIIRMVQERYFPEDWTEPELDTTTGEGDATSSIVPSTPEFGAARDIGVILEVTPQVESDGYTIGLDLRPQVLEFLGYDTSFNTTVETEGRTVEFKNQMPIIGARTVQTNVIIYDGETVVLGGMIREQVESFNDKVPILGDIPLMGRLFKNQGESVNKRNLLIFVTARLVDPAGQPRRVQEVPGLPDFRR